MKVVEVSQVRDERSTGMGRVCRAWGEAFRRHGHEWEHVGPEQVGTAIHPALFPHRARRWVESNRRDADLFLVHEPSGAAFLGAGAPLVVFSHGVERRGWEVGLAAAPLSGERVARRSRILFPLWRLRACDRALRRADHVLVLNEEDRRFCIARFERTEAQVSVVRNGVDPVPAAGAPSRTEPPTVLFLGTWLPRKGVRILARAAAKLEARGIFARWMLAGTQLGRDVIASDWPPGLLERTTVVAEFDPAQEPSLLSGAAIFVLPSFFEGQPLSLLQAMAHGRCCVTTACCGQQDLIVHGENGLLVEPGNASALAEALQVCLQSAETRARLGEAARESVVDRTWEKVGDELVSRIESLAGDVREAGRWRR